MVKGLSQAINRIDGFFDEYGSFYLDRGFYVPGFIVVMAATLNKRRITRREFDIHPDNKGYLGAIALSEALWGVDDYEYKRTHESENYSRLTLLDNVEATDQASTSVCSCIRKFFGGRQSLGLSDLIHVVGEMHDNVWSHGNSTGFSLAQKWCVPFSQGRDHFLEFALADYGCGFLNEMRRAGYAVNTDQEAIDWCIQEGNSTKHSDSIDGWAQALPYDSLGTSPYGDGTSTCSEVNHHQGLGLAHLVKLVRRYKGQLRLASGSCCLKIDETGVEQYITLESKWQGVALSCKFKESILMQQQDVAEDVDAELQRIMEQLGGS